MTKKQLRIAVAAIMLGSQIGSPAAADEPSREQLIQIAQYIDAGNLEALTLFLAENPELLEGDSPLAVLLRRFLAQAQDLWAYLAFDPPLRRALADSILSQDGRGQPPRAAPPGEPDPEPPLEEPGPADEDDAPTDVAQPRDPSLPAPDGPSIY